MLDSQGLTDAQRQAVEHVDGPLLILAGPGSGKTRVITHRIARLCRRGVDGSQILAITFTNKAAGEMTERVRRMLPGSPVWISTFHRFCARLLRARGSAVGLDANYTILDTSDQRQLIRQVLQDLDIDPVHFPPRKIAARISNAKNDLQTAEAVAERFADSVGNHVEAVLARVYPEYQKRLLQSNAVDFDDLLLHVVSLLSESEELRRGLGERYRYILVDEYQDTNLAQYHIVAAMAEAHHNLCVTGDPDQSIYGWRGARIDNILRFERDFPNATTVRLEQNFRSTKQILDAADRLIANNLKRKEKSLLTDNPEGDPVECLLFFDGIHEADEIARHIREAVESGERRWSDFALFYRVNALSRELERALQRHNIPYAVAAGLAFYERSEIKDVLAYLRLILNADDETAFRRVVNTPRRGIGKTTLARLSEWARSQEMSLFEAASRCEECDVLSKRAAGALKRFVELIGSLSLASFDGVAELLNAALVQTDYGAEWRHSESEQDQQRLANVQELLTASEQYDDRAEAPTLEGFLEETSLVNEGDNLDDDAGCVTLMTLHAAKGLEFPVVYIVGVEQDVLPHERALQQFRNTGDMETIEEERRLLFVGMTRAQERLFLTQTQSRAFRGRRADTVISDFLTEFPFTLTERTLSGNGGARESAQPGSAGEDATPADVPPRAGSITGASSGLMTGSDLLGGTAADGPRPRAETEVSFPPGFAVGSAVRHPRYGVGTVVDVGGYAKRRTVVVEFEDDRRQTFILDKSPLQPVGMR